MKRDNLRAAATGNIKLARHSDASLNGLKEGSRSETPPNDKSSDTVSNVNKPVNDLHIWRLFEQYCAVQVPNTHVLPLHSLATEQSGLETEIGFTRNELTRVIDGLFTGLRRTERPFRRNGVVMTQLRAA